MSAAARPVNAAKFAQRSFQNIPVHPAIRSRCGVKTLSFLGGLSFDVPLSRPMHPQMRFRSSVSESEVLKFSEFSKTWWDPSKNPLIAMNSVRVGYMVDQVNKAMEGNSIDRSKEESNQPPLTGLMALDVGCGGGLLSESLARLGATVTAVDPSRKLVKQAALHAQLDPRTRSIDYRGGYTVEQLRGEQKSLSSSASQEHLFDVICLLEVLEHVTDVDSILTSTQALLKPDTGRLFVSTLNRTMKSNLLAIIGAEYIMRYLPPGTHDWNQFRSPKEVEELANRAGLVQVDVHGMVVAKPPFLGQWEWRLDPNDVEVNWIATYKTKPITR